MPSLALMVASRPRKVFDRSLACWINAAMAALLDRTRVMGVWSAPVADAGLPAPTRHVIITPTITGRVVLVTALPPPDGHEAVGTVECGHAGFAGEHRQKRTRNEPIVRVQHGPLRVRMCGQSTQWRGRGYTITRCSHRTAASVERRR